MKTILRGIVSEEFLLESLSRHNAPTTLLRHWRWLRWIVAVLLILNGIQQMADYNFPLGIIFVSAGTISAIGPFIQKYSIIRRLRTSPFYQEEYTQTVTEEGVFIYAASSKSEFKWTAFSSAFRLRDGILLHQGKGVFYWMPKSRIIEGSIDLLWSVIPDSLKMK